MNLSKILINENKSIIDALNKLSVITDISRLILFVQNDSDQIIGSITDGDIRRSLRKNQNLNLSVKHICAENFSFIYENQDYNSFKKFRENNLKIIPVLNSKNKLIKVIDLDKQSCILPFEAVIMAGGRGKRLSPLTDKIPKPMLLLGDKPIIEHNIDKLISFGLSKINISVNYLGNIIEDYFGNGENKGIEIDYINEEIPLGTAGSLSLIKNIKSEYVLLMNSDLFTNIDLEKMYLELINSNADMIIASNDFSVSVPFAIFDDDSNNKIKSFVEKPKYTYSSNAGIYIFKTELINHIPSETFFDITDLIEKLIRLNYNIYHFPIRGFWIDIGRIQDYNKAQDLLKYQTN